LNPDVLDEPFQKLGDALRTLHCQMNEVIGYSAQLSHKVYIDPVTSILNRTYFEEYMTQILLRKKTVTLAYLDLDGLKYVNDHYGHVEGDHYIRTFAELIQKNFRHDDVFARIGGDEFCVVLEGNYKRLTERKLEDIRKTLIRENKKDYPVSFSYGVLLVQSSKNGITLDHVLRVADERMYSHKRQQKLVRA
jgi:diguanylate cyclase (GGDEF)-like protein